MVNASWPVLESYFRLLESSGWDRAALFLGILNNMLHPRIFAIPLLLSVLFGKRFLWGCLGFASVHFYVLWVGASSFAIMAEPAAWDTYACAMGCEGALIGAFCRRLEKVTCAIKYLY